MPPTGDTNGTVNVDVTGWNASTTTPPPPIPTPDPALTGGITPTDELVNALIAAANSGDPEDVKEVLRRHAERQLKTTDAAQKFLTNETGGQDQMTQLAQQLPQMAGSLAGAIAGALGGVIQPLTQIPQSLIQAGMGAMQTGMGMMQSTDPSSEINPDEWAADEFGSDPVDLGGGGDVSGGGSPEGLGGTMPMSMLSPAAAPTGTTTPTSGRAVVATPPVTTAQPTGYGTGMGGYPMMPPGAMGGAGAGGKDEKVDTKRVSVPSVKNGAPVQGRIIAPPVGPTVSKQVDGKAVVTKRILVPHERLDQPDGDQAPARRT